MRRTTTITFVLLSGWVISCGTSGPALLPYPHDTQDDDDGIPQSGGGGDPSSSAVGTTVGTSGTSVSSSSSSAGSTSSVSSVSAGPSATTGTGGGGQCVPDGDDSECVTCAKLSCCAEVQNCADDGSCSCWIDCFADTGGAIDLCIGQCGLPGGSILDLLDCSSLECELDCQI